MTPLSQMTCVICQCTLCVSLFIFFSARHCSTRTLLHPSSSASSSSSLPSSLFFLSAFPPLLSLTVTCKKGVWCRRTVCFSSHGFICALYKTTHQTIINSTNNTKFILWPDTFTRTHMQLPARDYSCIFILFLLWMCLLFHIAASLWCLCDTMTPSWRVNTR